MSTQSPHNFKTIYEFTVHVPKEIEREESVTEGDVTTIRKTKATEPTPVSFCYKKPSRFEREEAEVQRAGFWTQFLKKGVLPEAILLREYANWGGILNDYDREKYGAMRTSYVEADTNYQRAMATKDDAEALKHLNAMFLLKDKIVQFEREQNSYFENTAEAMTRNKYAQYCLLNFSYTRDAADKPWEPYFKGATLDEKYDSLETLEENRDAAFVQAGQKLLLIASLYVQAGQGLTKEDVESIEKYQAAEIDTKLPVTPAATSVTTDVPQATVT